MKFKILDVETIDCSTPKIGYKITVEVKGKTKAITVTSKHDLKNKIGRLSYDTGLENWLNSKIGQELESNNIG